MISCKDLQERCDRHGVEWRNRWGKGVEHHPRAVKVFEDLDVSDMAFGGGYFDWDSGGDGDNGECLMYALSALYELMDKEAASNE